MKNIANSARLRGAFLYTIVTVVFLLFPTFSPDVSAVSVPTMPAGAEFVNQYVSTTYEMTDGASVGAYSIIVPIKPGKFYTFRYFQPQGYAYTQRTRIGLFTSYPVVGAQGVNSGVTSSVRDGDYLTYTFHSETYNYAVIFLFTGWQNNPDIPARNLGIISPELFYDADINVSAFPERFYPGDSVLLIAANVTEENTFYSVGYRAVGDVSVTDIGTFGGDSYGFQWWWDIPYSMEPGSYEFVVRAQTPYQTIAKTVPFVVLFSPTPPIPTDSPPVTPDVSALPDASDFVVEIPDEFVDITGNVFGNLIPIELIPLLGMTMICLFLGLIVRGD